MIDTILKDLVELPEVIDIILKDLVELPEVIDIILKDLVEHLWVNDIFFKDLVELPEVIDTIFKDLAEHLWVNDIFFQEFGIPLWRHTNFFAEMEGMMESIRIVPRNDRLGFRDIYCLRTDPDFLCYS